MLVLAVIAAGVVGTVLWQRSLGDDGAATANPGKIAISDLPTLPTDPTSPSATAVGRPLRVAFIGDSYTAGKGDGGHPGDGFVGRLADHYGWDTYNLGSPKADYLSYVDQIPQLRSFKPQSIVVSGGRTILDDDPQVAIRKIPAFFRKLHNAYPKAIIVATSPLWDDTKPPALLDTLGQLVDQASIAVGGIYLDLGQPLQGHQSWISDDGVSPNAQGYAAIARAIERALVAYE